MSLESFAKEVQWAHLKTAMVLGQTETGSYIVVTHKSMTPELAEKLLDIAREQIDD